LYVFKDRDKKHKEVKRTNNKEALGTCLINGVMQGNNKYFGCNFYQKH
jgi:hypothetical protein